MSFDFQTAIQDYCEKVNLSDDEVDSLEKEHVKTMSLIGEMLSPSIAPSNICQACNLEQGSFWITCNASILDRIRPVKTGKPRAYKLFDALCQYKIYTPKK